MFAAHSARGLRTVRSSVTCPNSEFPLNFSIMAAIPPKGDTYGLSTWVRSPQNKTFESAPIRVRMTFKVGSSRFCASSTMTSSPVMDRPVSYTHLRAHETVLDLVCRLLL